MTHDELIGKVAELEERIARLEGPKAKSRTRRPGTLADGPTPVGQIRDAFLGSFRNKFGHDYAGWGARENGMASTWLKSVSLEAALNYTKIYPHWKEQMVTRAGHPFALLVQRYVQLDAHMQRYPDYVRDVIESKARDNVTINDKVKDHEIRLHADAGQAQSNPLIGGGSQGQIQNVTNPAISGQHSEPVRALRVVHGEGSS